MPPFSIIFKEKLAEDSGIARFIELGEVALKKVDDNELFGRALPGMYLCSIVTYKVRYPFEGNSRF